MSDTSIMSDVDDSIDPSPDLPSSSKTPETESSPKESAPEVAASPSVKVLMDGYDPTAMPDVFKDGEGNVKLADLLKAHNEAAEKNVFTGAPEKYEINPPKVEGFEAKQLSESVNTDDPLFVALSKYGKEKGLPQGEFDKILQDAITSHVKQAEQFHAEEKAKFGKGEEDILERNAKFFKANMPEDQFEHMKLMMQTAEDVRVMDSIRKSFLDRFGSVGAPGSASEKKDLTEAELRALIKDPAYYNSLDPRHAELRNMVSEGYKSLYPS